MHPKASAEFAVELDGSVVDVDLTPWLGGAAVRDLIVEVVPRMPATAQPVSEIAVLLVPAPGRTV